MPSYILETRGLTKLFSGVIALNQVDLRVKSGSIHGIVGENGAGKSTLIMTLAGVHQPDEGCIILNNEQVAFHSAKEALDKGISVVFQELSIIPSLSIAENIFANRQPLTKYGTIDWQKLWADSQAILDLFELKKMNPHTIVGTLSASNQQLIEILKAVAVKPKVLILDEPTSSLTEVETKKLFQLLKKMKQDGCTILYISHHLQEIFAICDEVSIFRDGRHICVAEVTNIDEHFLIEKMVGREINNIYGIRPLEKILPSEPLLHVEGLSREGEFYNVSFDVYPGEIVTLSGLIGSGRTEVCRSIFGVTKLTSGKIIFDKREYKIEAPYDAMRLGISYVTEDRKNEGLFLQMSIRLNIIANQLRSISRYGIIHEEDQILNADEIIKKYSVVSTNREQAVATLSGGNQQKVLLAEWVEIMPKLLIVDEPTRGIDVGAKSEIYRILMTLAASGVGILMVSSDLLEVINLSDRIIVMRSGTISGELAGRGTSEVDVLRLAAG